MSYSRKACVPILVGLISSSVTAYSQQSLTSDCPSFESYKLPSESKQELAEYARTFADSVNRSWNVPPDRAYEEHWSAIAEVKIAKDGQVAAVNISSGHPLQDQAASNAIRRASPFASLPRSAHVECIAIHLKFSSPPEQKVMVAVGGVYRVGGGVSAPKPIYNPDPEYSKEARKAKLQGVCILSVIISPEGDPRDIRVARSLGMGLDEKAIEAVKRWKFQPSMLNGKPVAVAINVEILFRL